MSPFCFRCGTAPRDLGTSPYCASCRREYRQQQAAGLPPIPARRCAQCGTRYTPKQRTASSRFCSDACNADARADREKEARQAQREQRPSIPCAHCGAPVDVARKRRGARFCSSRCNDAAHHVGRRANQRYSPEFKRTLLQRDGATCALCSHPLDLETPWPDPRFASVDHVQPVSRYGDHHPANLRLVCLTCNTSRQARF